MNSSPLGIVANIAGILGIFVCAVAGIGRILGAHYLIGYQSMTLFLGGIALMLLAVLIKLHGIEAKLADKR